MNGGLLPLLQREDCSPTDELAVARGEGANTGRFLAESPPGIRTDNPQARRQNCRAVILTANISRHGGEDRRPTSRIDRSNGRSTRGVVAIILNAAKLAMLRFATAYRHQHDSADQTDATDDRWKRNSVPLGMTDLEWAKLGVFLFFSPAEAAPGKTDNPDDNQNDPNDSRRFHGSDVTTVAGLESIE